MLAPGARRAGERDSGPADGESPAVVSFLRLVSLKLLNSIVLLGKSCVYIKRAKMEDQLFQRPAANAANAANAATTTSSHKEPERRADDSRCQRAASGESLRWRFLPSLKHQIIP